MTNGLKLITWNPPMASETLMQSYIYICIFFHNHSYALWIPWQLNIAIEWNMANLGHTSPTGGPGGTPGCQAAHISSVAQALSGQIAGHIDVVVHQDDLLNLRNWAQWIRCRIKMSNYDVQMMSKWCLNDVYCKWCLHDVYMMSAEILWEWCLTKQTIAPNGFGCFGILRACHM